MISLRHVSKSYAQFQAINSISLTVNKGEIFGIIGPSGAGKSTLLRLMNVLEMPDQGEVVVNGQQLTSLSQAELRKARQSIGMIFQHFNLLGNKTVYSNVAIPLELTGYSKNERQARVMECLAFVGLEHAAHQYPAQLSGGQKQRVAIARALANQPQVLLCDEPTSSLDSSTTAEVLHVLHKINQELGVTIVIVSHELEVIKSLCHRVAVISDGELYETVVNEPTGIVQHEKTPQSFVQKLKERGLPIIPDILVQYQSEIIESIGETFIMVGVAVAAAILIGLPVGTFLYLSSKGNLKQNQFVYSVLNVLVNTIRSFPFLLLVVFLIPFTRMIIGTAMGTTAATVPLAIIAIAHYARLVEQSLLDVPRGVMEAAVSMGASLQHIIFKFLYVEARSGLLLGLTTSTVSFISYSTIMGVVGGGGIGDFAIRYGYQQFKTDLMLYVIIIMVILVQLIQYAGTTIARKIDKR